jgi:DNA polymerase-3 subunit alpha
MEKSVLGFYMSGHPLFEYRSLLKYLCTGNSITGKNKYKDMSLVGIVSNFSRKKDNKGNPIAFVEMEDLSGKFEVPLFNRDYERYMNLIEIGKVFYVSGAKSLYNGNDDGILRILPKALIPFDELPQVLRGSLKIRLQNHQIKKGYLSEISTWCKRKPGNVSLQVTVEASDMEYYTLETKDHIFPDNTILIWLDKQGLEFGLDVYTDEKKDY